MEKRDKLRKRGVDDTPESSRFLLEMDYDNLLKCNIRNKTCWVAATEATINRYPALGPYSSTTVNWTLGKPDTTDIRTWILRDSA